MSDITRWLAGAEKPSLGTFLKVIDILIEENRTRAERQQERADRSQAKADRSQARADRDQARADRSQGQADAIRKTLTGDRMTQATLPSPPVPNRGPCGWCSARTASLRRSRTRDLAKKRLVSAVPLFRSSHRSELGRT